MLCLLLLALLHVGLLFFFCYEWLIVPAVQTLAEKAGWDLAKQHGFDLVTINPVFVFGPVLSSRADATSILMMKVPVLSTRANLVIIPCVIITSVTG